MNIRFKPLKISLSLLSLAFATFAPAGFLAAQNRDFRYTASLSVSSSAVGVLFSGADAVTTKFSSWSRPAVQGTFDYRLYKNWLTIGAAASWQEMGLIIYNQGIPVGTDTIRGDVGVDLTRLNLAARTLFHYGNQGRFDMYSGIRIGYHRNAVSTSTNEILYNLLHNYTELTSILRFLSIGPDAVWNPVVQHTFGFQVILFGFRAYVLPRVGVNAELAVGRPNFFSAGISYRFR